MPLGAICSTCCSGTERPALNVLLYTLFVVIVGAGRACRATRRNGVPTGFRLTLAGTLLSAAMVAWYGSGAALLLGWPRRPMWLGYRNQPHLKLVVYALLTAMGSACRAVPGWRNCSFCRAA